MAMRSGLLICNNHHQAGKTAVCSSVCPIQGSHILEKIRISGKKWPNKPPYAIADGPIFAWCVKAVKPNPELFIIRSFGHNKNWHKIKEKRRRRRRWRRRIFGGKPEQSSTDLLCWSYNSSTGRSCLYDSLLHEKVQKYFSSSPKVLKIGHIMPERYDPSTAPRNHLHDNMTYIVSSMHPKHPLISYFNLLQLRTKRSR